jgi:hypothetical protein
MTRHKIHKMAVVALASLYCMTRKVRDRLIEQRGTRYKLAGKASPALAMPTCANHVSQSSLSIET